ncbi:MAG: Inositol-1-monophosphatase [Alphaproteobacteria bacterium MarineAlpha3_Bin5]|nr:inositol-1-monophosphatase [Magnetovibrio sp.]PPR76256.1 MAG: Inositol-1-monophosphatase [Alphaproteobacteria bacterium MarineAlpha3_Bin5]
MTNLFKPNPLDVNEIIRETAEVAILPRFTALKPHDILKKRSGELVTSADIEAEKLLELKLLDLFPGSVCVGEEAYGKDQEVIKRLNGDSPVWVIDPLDGTSNFCKGKAKFAIIVALIIKAETVAGWIYDPNEKISCISERGSGTWLENKRLQIRIPSNQSCWRASLSQKLVIKLEKKNNFFIHRENIVRYHCVGLEYIELAKSNLQFARYGGSLKPWDHAAGELIHSEAGGISGDNKTGRPYDLAQDTFFQSILLAPDRQSWIKFSEIIN